ncbi:MAG TPA: DNA repair exonuclease [Candidatus Limnocylindrales bacterium]|jgi:DNA repair exonuclease SbcCD nuclease subunit
MLRLVHTADVHIGARHAALGDQASVLRERQFAAFRAAVDLAIGEKVDLFLVAGDLFDSNTQPRRSVERVAMEISRLREAGIRSVIIPGTHDVYDRASIFRAYDLPRMAGNQPGEDWVTVLTPGRPDVHLQTCDVVVHGPVFATKRAPHSPLLDLRVAEDTRATWHVGLVHAAIAIPGKTDGDDVVVTPDEIGETGLDYLALGHWHSTQQGKSGRVTYAYAGAPEPTAIDQAGAGSVLVVTLDGAKDARTVRVEGRRVGRTSFESIEVDAASIGSQPALVERLTAKADADLVLDVRVIGVRPDNLDLHVEELEDQLRSSFLRVRVRDRSLPALTEGSLPPADTIAGAFIRDTEARVAELEAADRADEAAELRDVLRLGRLLLAGHEVSL